MARLNIRKRTRQLDDARSVVLAGRGDNTIHTTVGELAMSGDEKSELSHKLRAQKRLALVQKAVEQVYTTAASFLEACLLDLAPGNVVDSYTSGDSKLFEEWMSKSPFKFVLDGLTAHFFYHGREIAAVTAKVDAWIKDDVVQAIKFEQAMARTMPGGGKA